MAGIPEIWPGLPYIWLQPRLALPQISVLKGSKLFETLQHKCRVGISLATLISRSLDGDNIGKKITELGNVFCHQIQYKSKSVLLSRPSKDGFARLDGHLGKIARLTPVFL